MNEAPRKNDEIEMNMFQVPELRLVVGHAPRHSLRRR